MLSFVDDFEFYQGVRGRFGPLAVVHAKVGKKASEQVVSAQVGGRRLKGMEKSHVLEDSAFNDQIAHLLLDERAYPGFKVYG